MSRNSSEKCGRDTANKTTSPFLWGLKKTFRRIFFATDIHGSDIVFRKFISAAKSYKAHILILGGDLTGKMVIPIVAQPDGTYRVNFLGTLYVLKTEGEAQKIEATIKDSGFYAYYTDPTELEELEEHKEKADDIFRQLMIERLKQWMELAEDRLREMDVQCYITGGNDDGHFVEEILKNYEPHIVDPEGKIVEIDGFEMCSCGYSNLTPWDTPRECSEEELSKMIDGMVSKVKDVGKCVCNLHAPPKDSALDSCPKLDTSVYPPKPVTTKAGAPIFFGAGSVAVHNAIEKYQPMLGLHGHIHESRGAVRIGRTLCINPGSEYGEGILGGAIINLRRDKGILSYQLTSG